MKPIFNFSAGPAVLPKAVLARAQAEMLDWHGSGMSVMEMSHRGKEFTSILVKTEADFRKLLNIPNTYKVLFLQGGAIAENAIIPMNLLNGKSADYVVTGAWSKRSVDDAKAYGNIHVVASSEADGSQWFLDRLSVRSHSRGDFTWHFLAPTIQHSNCLSLECRRVML